MKRIGFIGIGVMGKSMVRNLMKKGFLSQFTQEPKARRWMLSKRVQSGVIVSPNVFGMQRW